MHRQRTTSRADHPVIEHTARGSRALMFTAIATKEGREQALDEVNTLRETANSKRTSESLWHTWCEVMQSWDRPPMPLDVEKVGFMAASLRAGRYRSAEPYFNRARIEHIRRFDKSPGPAVLDAIRQYARAVERGTGPSRLKDALQLQEIEDYIELPTATELYTGDMQEALWPAGLVVLGSWWMTRSIEATAARVRHVTVNEAKTTVAWCLPASKTDTKALSATRTHRCHCGADQSSAQAHRHKNCPYHVMYDNIQLIAKVFSMNLQDEAFLDMPLFPTKSGLVLSHAASVRAIRAVAVKAGIPTTRTIDTTVLEKFGEHTPRVSGAQFFAAVLSWELYLIQLYGRWGSLAVARYVQDAPLARASSASKGVSIEDVMEMLKLTNPDEDIRKEINAIKRQLAEQRDEISFQAITDKAQAETRLALTRQQPRDETHEGEPQAVLNLDSKVVHEILIFVDIAADPSAGHGGITSCGWKYALGRHKLVHFDVSAGSAYGGATSTCKACIRAAARRDSLDDVSDENDSE